MAKSGIGTRHLAGRNRSPGVAYSRERTPVWASRATRDQALERQTRERGAHNRAPFDRGTGEFKRVAPPDHGRGWIGWPNGRFHVVDMTPVQDLPRQGRRTNNADDLRDRIHGPWEPATVAGTPLAKVNAGDYVARVCRNDRGRVHGTGRE